MESVRRALRKLSDGGGAFWLAHLACLRRRLRLGDERLQQRPPGNRQHVGRHAVEDESARAHADGHRLRGGFVDTQAYVDRHGTDLGPGHPRTGTGAGLVMRLLARSADGGLQRVAESGRLVS